ncbi:MAG TPA: type II secretion system protein [Thermoanaerobaculia bacterium]|nr:type II secretion system protein [Thermoanaerobaculia bacterium]
MRDQRGFSIRGDRGFSLVEILVAILILTLVITFSLAAFVERKSRLQQASEIVLAYQALANEAEYRRRISFAALEGAEPEFLSDTTILRPLQPFSTIVSVTQGKPGVKNVLMTIRWRNGERQAKLELVRADTGGSNLW